VVNTLKSSLLLGFLRKSRALDKLMRGSAAQATGRREGDSLRGQNTKRAPAYRVGSPLLERYRILAESKALKATVGLG
jgi:hypothetical protein